MKNDGGSKDLKFIPYSVPNRADAMDVPFRIVGHKLRWLSGRKNEDSFTRPWKVLRKSELPASVIRDLESRSVNVFRDGDTIRFGENVLGYASDEFVNKAKALVEADTRSQRESIGMASSNRPGVRISEKDTEVVRVGADEFNN